MCVWDVDACSLGERLRPPVITAYRTLIGWQQFQVSTDPEFHFFQQFKICLGRRRGGIQIRVSILIIQARAVFPSISIIKATRTQHRTSQTHTHFAWERNHFPFPRWSFVGQDYPPLVFNWQETWLANSRCCGKQAHKLPNRTRQSLCKEGYTRRHHLGLPSKRFQTTESHSNFTSSQDGFQFSILSACHLV